jgi:catechol 2,3-dioxygenase-like lactoylglutathione lyase family enzyme
VSLRSADLIAFVPTTDQARAREFYGRTLGLELIQESSFASAFDANGTELRVTVVEEAAAAPYTVLGWRVDDIDRAIRNLASKGIEFERYDGMEQDEVGVWTAPGGSRIAWFKDPDGNTLSLQQA